MPAYQSQPEYSEIVKITVSKLSTMEESLRRLDSKMPSPLDSENDFKRVGDQLNSLTLLIFILLGLLIITWVFLLCLCCYIRKTTKNTSQEHHNVANIPG